MLQYLVHFHKSPSIGDFGKQVIQLCYPLPKPIAIMKAIMPIAIAAPFLLSPINLDA